MRNVRGTGDEDSDSDEMLDISLSESDEILDMSLPRRGDEEVTNAEDGDILDPN